MAISHLEEGAEALLLQAAADDAQPAGIVRRAGTDLMVLRHIVKVIPHAVAAVYNALGPQHRAVRTTVQGGEDLLQLLGRKGVGGLHAPAGEHLVGVMAVVMMVVAAAAVVVMVVMMLMLMLMIVVTVVVIMVVLMLMVAMIMVMMMLVIVVTVIVVMVMLMVMIVVVVAAAYRADLLLGHEISGQGVALLHGGEELAAGELVPGGGDDGGVGVLAPEDSYRLLHLGGGWPSGCG